MASKRSRTIEDSSEEDDYREGNDESADEVEEESAASGDEGRVEDEDEDEVEEDEDEDGDEDEDEEEEDEDEDEEEEEEEELSVNAGDDDGQDEEEEEEDADEDAEEGVGGNAEAPRRMTARQRNKRDGTSANIGLIDLAEIEGTNRPKKVQLTAEEQRIKRAEMARRRRNLSQQRLEEEKKETLDKLLKKRAKKVRGSSDEDGNGDVKTSRSRLHPPHPALTSWRSSPSGLTLSMTEERAHIEKIN